MGSRQFLHVGGDRTGFEDNVPARPVRVLAPETLGVPASRSTPHRSCMRAMLLRNPAPLADHPLALEAAEVPAPSPAGPAPSRSMRETGWVWPGSIRRADVAAGVC